MGCRRVGAERGAPGGTAGEGILLAGGAPGRRDQRAAPRRHRNHMGAPCPRARAPSALPRGELRRRAGASARDRRFPARRRGGGPERPFDRKSGRALMDYRDNTEEAQFRAELRSWLAEHAPTEPPPRDADARMEYNHQWHLALAEGGWLGLSFPVEYGGQGRSLIYDAILNDELGAAGLPSVPAINHITNAIRLFGTEEQKREHLPGLLSCTVLWCQGFSEPNAGSDLSSLRTRGVRV